MQRLAPPQQQQQQVHVAATAFRERNQSGSVDWTAQRVLPTRSEVVVDWKQQYPLSYPHSSVWCCLVRFVQREEQNEKPTDHPQMLARMTHESSLTHPLGIAIPLHSRVSASSGYQCSSTHVATFVEA